MTNKDISPIGKVKRGYEGILISWKDTRRYLLNLFVDNNANSMLGNIVDSSSFAVVTFVGHSFLNSAHSLDVYNITFLVDSQVCVQNNSMFSKRPKEPIAGASPLSLCIGHFGE